MMITVVFASHNGAGTLPRMLDALSDINVPEGGWQLVAVDNASDDATRQVLEAYQDRLPLTVLSCPERGKNRALNHALDAVQGELVVFTDDDILPEPDWLLKLAAAAETHPGHDIFGGAIVPSWDVTPEPWLLEGLELGAAFGLTDPDRQAGEVTPNFVWGANMAVRAGLFREGHRFNENIGPGPGQYVMGSETEFTMRMADQGHRCYYLPDAVVAHMVPPEHMQRAWLMRRAFRAGRGYWVRWLCGEDYSGPRWFGAPRYLYGQLLRDWGHCQWMRLTAGKGEQLRADWVLHKTRGMISQARLEHRD